MHIPNNCCTFAVSKLTIKTIKIMIENDVTSKFVKEFIKTTGCDDRQYICNVLECADNRECLYNHKVEIHFAHLINGNFKSMVLGYRVFNTHNAIALDPNVDKLYTIHLRYKNCQLEKYTIIEVKNIDNYRDRHGVDSWRFKHYFNGTLTREMAIGGQVYWHDPENISSGYYEIVGVQGNDPDEIVDDEMVISLSSMFSQCECTMDEIYTIPFL